MTNVALAFLLLSGAASAKERLGGPMPALPAAQRFMALSNANIVGIGSYTPSSAHAIFRKQECTGPWGTTALRWGYGGWTVQTGGQNPAELAMPNNYTVDWTAVEYPNGTLSGAATFASSQSVTISAATAGAWTDPFPIVIPANTCYYIWQSETPTAAGQLPVTSTAVINGEGTAVSNTPYPVAIATIAGFGSMSGPFGVVAQGWDGTTPAILAVGDSICQQFNDNAPDARGNWGYVRRGFDDNTVAPRYTMMSLCISGTRPSDQASSTPGNLGYRMQWLGLLSNQPYTSVFSEMGVNSVGDGQPTFGNEMSAWWAFLHGAFPYVPVIQAVLTPNTGGGSADGYTTSTGTMLTTSAIVSTGSTSIPLNSLTGSNSVTVQPGWFAYGALDNFIPFQSVVTSVTSSPPSVTISSPTTGGLPLNGTVTFGSQLVNSAFGDCNQAVNARCTENITIFANAAPHQFQGIVDITPYFWDSWSNPINAANNPVNSYWPAPNFSTTLAAAVTGGSTNPISMTAAPAVGDFLVFEPGVWVQTTTTVACTPSTCTSGTVIPVASTSSQTTAGTNNIGVGDYAYSSGATPARDTVCGVSGSNITLCTAITGNSASGAIWYFGKQEAEKPFTTACACAQTVLSVTGTGPYNVLLTGAPFLSHASGSVVASAWVSDAVHPSGSLAQIGGPAAIGAAKNAGVFK